MVFALTNRDFQLVTGLVYKCVNLNAKTSDLLLTNNCLHFVGIRARDKWQFHGLRWAHCAKTIAEIAHHRHQVLGLVLYAI